jgi:alkylation response protein AidB-like acyl-CoA dehydrogenase
MAWFTDDQEFALYQVHRHDALYGDMLDFLKGPLADFAGSVIAPQAMENEQKHHFSVENFRQLGELGFMAMYYPEQWGGLDASFVYFLAGLETLAKADAGFTLGVAIHGTATSGIQMFGTDDQKAKYVEKLATGQWVGAFALSEAEAGSDAQSMVCEAKKDGDEFVINGTKYWITNGMDADVFFLFARDPEADGVTAFIVERGWAGSFETKAIEGKMGVRSSNTAELVFDDYRVPAANIVGERGQAFKFAMHMLNGGRTTIGAWSTGIAQAAYEKFLKYAHERELFGKHLKDLDGIKKEVSEMHMRIRAGRNLTLAAGLARDEGKNYGHLAAEAKVCATEAAFHVAERAIELSGGYGYTDESCIERHLRDAILGRIGEGANEVLQVVVIPRFIYKHFADNPITEIW